MNVGDKLGGKLMLTVLPLSKRVSVSWIAANATVYFFRDWWDFLFREEIFPLRWLFEFLFVENKSHTKILNWIQDYFF